MPLPNFLVIGAAKAGTTSLHHYLAQHPDIYMSRYLEPSFFAHANETLDFKGPGDDDWTFVTNYDDYARLFEARRHERKIGEISPRYLYFERASERIKHYVPEARLVAILRHPVDRAYSHFLMNKARDCEPMEDLAGAMELEADRRARGWGWDWCYVGAGLYHRQLSRYFERFDRSQIKVLLYDDYRADARRFVASIFEFLEVDSSFEPDLSLRRREAGLPRSYLLRHALERRYGLKHVLGKCVPKAVKQRTKTWLRAQNTVAAPSLPPATRDALFARHFAADCARLSELIERDLSAWAPRSEEAGEAAA